MKYYEHRRKATENPNKYMLIIIDGMDQSKTAVPHFLEQTKSTSLMYRLKMHVTGVLVHSQHTYGFFDYGQFHHSSTQVQRFTPTSLVFANGQLRQRK